MSNRTEWVRYLSQAMQPLAPMIFALTFALPTLAVCGATGSAAASPLEVGFGSATLWGAWETNRQQADDFDVRVLAVRGRGPADGPNSQPTLALVAVADQAIFFPSTCVRLRAVLAHEFPTSRDSIGIFSTQNHGGEFDGPLHDYAKMDAAFVQATREAIAALTPVEMATVAVRPDPPLVHRRRVPLEGVGNFTFWFGWRQRGADPWDASQADASHMLRQALADLMAGVPYQRRSVTISGGPDDYTTPALPLPVPDVVLQPPANDPLLQGLFFRDLQGRPVGSLVRFASHPNIANLGGRPSDSGDYPVYVRRRLEKVFGGTGLFMTGPCGDQASAVGGKGLRQAEEFGARLADEALQGLDAGARWERGGAVAAASPIVDLRIREDFPASLDAAKKLDADLRERIRQVAAEFRTKLAAAESARMPSAQREALARTYLADLKRLSDQWEPIKYVSGGALQSWIGMDLTGKAGQTIRHPLFVLRIGSTVIVGLPGEPFGGYSARLRRETLGDNLIVCEEGNGYLAYIPTAVDIGTGGYEPSATVVDASAEEALVAGVRAGMVKVGANDPLLKSDDRNDVNAEPRDAGADAADDGRPANPRHPRTVAPR
jgi:hypothetical protein